MAETSVSQLEAEIELLNRLVWLTTLFCVTIDIHLKESKLIKFSKHIASQVSQREEDTRCTKMMLKFREDKIQRMESLLGGLMSADDYLREENNSLSEEIQLLRSRLDKNPEVTRFAAENIRLLDQVRWYVMLTCLIKFQLKNHYLISFLKILLDLLGFKISMEKERERC